MLPIGDDVNSLEPIAKVVPQKSTYEITETFILPSADGKDVELRVFTVFTRDEADYFRLKLARQNQSEMQRLYRDYYNKLYPGIEIAFPTKFTDDRDLNRMTVEERYRIGWQAFNANELATQFPLSASGVDDILKAPNPSGRTAPIVLSHPLNRQHHINVLGLKTTYTPPEDVSIKSDLLTFKRSSNAFGSSMHLNWALMTRANEVPADQAAAFASDVSKIGRANYMTYDFTHTGSVAQEDDEWSEDDWTDIILLGFIALILPLVIFGARYGLKADQSYAESAMFFPISISKFSLMSIVTFGLYSSFWMWKHWRWLKNKESLSLWPFWRAVFSIFWLYPAYNAAVLKSETKPDAALGVVGAIFYFLAMGYSNSTDDDWSGIAVGVISFLGFIPAVVLVNKLNGNDSVALAANSEFNYWNIIGIVGGIVLLCGLVWSSFIE